MVRLEAAADAASGMRNSAKAQTQKHENAHLPTDLSTLPIDRGALFGPRLWKGW